MTKSASEALLYRRLVVKVGTSLLTAGTPRLDLEMMAALVGQIARLHQKGVEIILVSSGAIAAGKHKLGLTKERRDMPFRQVLAAVGQSSLMHAYDQLFSWHGITVAQALLTRMDLSDREGYLNIRNTLLALWELGVVPVVNENDVVSVEEIQEMRFGDNDNLSAMVANLVDADLLVILSDIGGLYTADPHKDASARLVPRVERIDAGIERLAGDAGSPVGVGGMATKIQAAKLATASGVGVVIADGRERDVIVRLTHGETLGTFFVPLAMKIESRKRWMLSGPAIKFGIVVDDGAASALKEQGKSLLPAGVVEVRGEFQRGEVISIFDSGGRRIGYGITNYSARDIAIIKGARSSKIAELLGHEYGSEVVHRNNLAVL